MGGSTARVVLVVLVVGAGGCFDLLSCDGPSVSVAWPSYDVPDCRASRDICAALPPPSFSDLTCEGDCTDMVMSRIIMPDAATATQYGWDFNDDGTPDNALGSIVGVVQGVCGYSGTQPVDQLLAEFPVTSGQVLNLLRLKATAHSLANTGPAQVQVWIGETRDCCPQATVYACPNVAETTCFSGSSPHSKDLTVPGSPPMGGTVDQGKLLLGPGQVRLRFPVPCSTSRHVDLTLQHARIVGQWTDGAITKGMVAGVISLADSRCTLLPLFAEGLTDSLESSFLPQYDKDVIRTLFDFDRDDVIEADELACNSIFQTFMSGDVDVDQDGEYEISFGVGFEAVGAVIVPSGATDLGPDLAQDAGVDAAAADHGE
jgi:hypothetical protein